MSSTLPRAKSLGVTDTRSLTRNYKKPIHERPSSLCEALVHRVGPIRPSEELPDRLKRTPSQANCLSTTVPTSLVSQNLGGRHAPTRSSLKHSRMVLMARTGRSEIPCRRKPTDKFRCIVSFIICSYMFVGVVDVLLAVFLLYWVPSLHFFEVPHYPGAAILLSGLFSAFALRFKSQVPNNKRTSLKVLVFIILIVSTLSSTCALVFDAMHLIYLAPKECGMKKYVEKFPTFPTPTSSEFQESLTPYSHLTGANMSHSGAGGDNTLNNSRDINASLLYLSENEGIASFKRDNYLMNNSLPKIYNPANSEAVFVNSSICVCYDKYDGWKISKIYPRLSCEEVKNILPIFLVASCVLMIAGAVISCVILYLHRTLDQFLSHSQQNYLVRPETKPFIYSNRYRSPNKRPSTYRASSNGLRR